MKLIANDSITIKYRKDDDQSTALMLCTVAYIRQSQIPESFFIYTWEKTKYANPQLLASKPESLGMRWSIRLNNFVIVFKNEQFANNMFDLFLTDFEGCDITKKFPEYFL